MSRFIHFLRYDNTVPIVLGILFLGATGTYAATNPEAVYQATEHVLSIDNSYIASKDLSNYTPRAEITGVTEDSENYYVAYKFSTIDLKDGAWQDVVKDEVMTVSKADLGQYRDLGLFVMEQIRQKIDRELARLKETQEFEKKNVTQKMVATAYSGLIGAMLTDSVETIANYTPVVTPPESPETIFTEPVPFPPEMEEEVVPPPQQEPVEEEPSEEPAEQPETPDEEPDENATSTPSTPSTGLTLQLLGDNPAHVTIGGTYTDLGVVATNNANESISVKVFVNGAEVTSVSIDTSAAATFTIRYVATDASGSVEKTRTVEVTAPAPENPTPEPETPSASTTPETPAPETPPAEEPAPETTPEPEPEPETPTAPAKDPPPQS